MAVSSVPYSTYQPRASSSSLIARVARVKPVGVRCVFGSLLAEVFRAWKLDGMITRQAKGLYEIQQRNLVNRGQSNIALPSFFFLWLSIRTLRMNVKIEPPFMGKIDYW